MNDETKKVSKADLDKLFEQMNELQKGYIAASELMKKLKTQNDVIMNTNNRMAKALMTLKGVVSPQYIPYIDEALNFIPNKTANVISPSIEIISNPKKG